MGNVSLFSGARCGGDSSSSRLHKLGRGTVYIILVGHRRAEYGTNYLEALSGKNGICYQLISSERVNSDDPCFDARYLFVHIYMYLVSVLVFFYFSSIAV